MTHTHLDLSNFSMLDIFRMEVETQVALLNDNLLAVESQPNASDDIMAKRLESLMRAAHSIKGAARIVGLEPAVNVAHVMEDCFVAAQKGQICLEAETVDGLLNGVDWFTQLSQVQDADLTEWLMHQADDMTELIAAIAQAMANPLAPHSTLPVSAPPPPQPAPVSKTAEASTSTPDRVVRVNVDNLNQLMGLAGEALVEASWLDPFANALLHLKQQQQAVCRLLEKLQQDATLSPAGQHYLDQAQEKALDSQALLSDRLGDLDQFSRRFSQLSDNLYREVIANHMRPFADGIQGFPRMVRDLAKQLGKQVQLDIVGGATQVDRDILEKLEAPLSHILSNAIAHGIEAPEQRRAMAKPETGTIRLEASHRAGMLSILISDDGRGVSLEALRQNIVQKQLTTLDLATQLSDAELLEFLFLPGFSTADEVTEVAGRGVGLDIAKTTVQEVGGLLRVFSNPNQGLTFHFQLPLTLSVIRALLVEIAGEPYAFGLTRIDQVLMVNQTDIMLSENLPYIVVNDENISLAQAHRVLGLPRSPQSPESTLSVVILSDNTHRYGLIVDRFLEERELVVRPLDPRLGKVQDISAAALTEDGLPLLIIDVADLVRSIDQLVSGGNIHLLNNQAIASIQAQQKRVLVVDDSITVREMERKLLQNRGYQVDVAINGMEGWNTVRTGNYNLVISDIDMPRMNGVELVRQIKAHPQLKHLPVIIVSYKDRQEDQIAGLEAGADYYLTKSSFHDNSLLNAVVDLIGE